MKKYLILTFSGLFLLLGPLACGSGKKTRTPVPSAKSGKKVPPPAPPPPSGPDAMEGIASWYGKPYHGRRTSSGEVYSMYAMTAAHQTLPFDSRVQVTNLENKKKTIVRINDRGPFVDGRIIDLSLAAAKDIDMVAPGTAPVRLKLLPTRALAKGQSARYTVQVGFFEEKENAVRLQAQLKSGYPKSAIVPASDGGFRVQVGEMDTRSEAEKAQQRLQKDGFAGFVRLLGK